MGAIGAHVPRSVETGIPPAPRDVELRIEVDASKAIGSLLRARVQAALIEIQWRAAVSAQHRDERRAKALVRRLQQKRDRQVLGVDRETLRHGRTI